MVRFGISLVIVLLSPFYRSFTLSYLTENNFYYIEPCEDYLLFGSNNTDFRISVSSSIVNEDLITDGSMIQLDFDIKGTNRSCGWIPSVQDGYQYLQVEFRDDKTITGIAVQWGCNGYVTNIRVFHSFNCKDWKHVPTIETEVDPRAPTNITTTKFENAIKANCVRFNPVNWIWRIAMRVEIIGC